MSPTPEPEKGEATGQEQMANHAMHTDGNSAALHSRR